jgi:hypothetical protein
MVPVMVAVPGKVGEVNIAVWVPFSLLVTLLNDPAVVLSVTVPMVNVLLPFASSPCTVMVEVFAPLATIEGGLAVMVVLAALISAVNDTETGFPMSTPAMVPVMAVPAVVEAVNIAV